LLLVFLGMELPVTRGKEKDGVRKKTRPKPSLRVQTWGPAESRGQFYAFLVGVGDYDDKELKPLKYPQKDITEFHAALLRSGFKKGNIILMHDEQKRRYQPEAKKIREELNLLLGRVGKNDTILVALAGHGVQFKGSKTSYFCPADARLSDVKTLIPLEELYQDLDDCKAGRKLLLVDACRNDPQSRVSRSRAKVSLEKLTSHEAAVPKGIVALFSCSDGQESFEHPRLRHGVFFYYVLQGWRGAADLDGDGTITLDELAAYVKLQTKKYVHLRLRANQTPHQRGMFDGEWPLLKRRARTLRAESNQDE
jgi:uncharacterized caspase-like protein